MSSEIGFGIVGVGNIALIHAQALATLAPRARLRAFLGRRPEAVDKLASQFAAEAMVDAPAFFARPDIQVVTICTPSGTHCELGRQAAAAGKHVVVEKPIDVTVARGRELCAACDEHGVALATIFQSRFLPAVALIKRAIDAGRLGRLYMVDAYVKWFRSQEYYQAAKWRGTLALDGGGALINQAIHTVDLAQYFAGPAASVYGLTERKRHPYIEGEDTALALVRYQGGAVGVLEATTSVAPGFSRRVEIHGEKGSIILDGNDISVWSLEGRGPEDDELERLRASQKDASDGASNPMNLDIGAHTRQFQDFLDALEHKRRPAVDGREALKALAIVTAVYRSAELGQPVTPEAAD